MAGQTLLLVYPSQSRLLSINDINVLGPHLVVENKMLTHSYRSLICTIVLTGTAIGMMLASLPYVRNRIHDYQTIQSFNSVKTGDNYSDIVTKIGEGAEVTGDEIPSIPSAHSPKYVFSQSRIVPIVEGTRVFFWQGAGCALYVSFDDKLKVIEARIVDSNDL